VGEGAEDRGWLGEVRGGEEGRDVDAGHGDGWSVRGLGDEGAEGEARGGCEEAEEGLGDAGHGWRWREESRVTCDWAWAMRGMDGDGGKSHA
jgi:hypothetical protein